MVVAAAGLVLVAAALWIGGRAGSVRPTPLRRSRCDRHGLEHATSLLRRAGDVHIQVQRVSYGAPAGTVHAEIRGVGFDGYYTRDSNLLLRVGR